MKLGMGVAVPGLRLAPTLAAGMATLNMIAPGRCFVAMGTGNTAMRLLGRKPMTLKNFEAYARIVRNLLDGKEAEYEHRGEKHTRPLHAHRKGLPQSARSIPMYLAGLRPEGPGAGRGDRDGLTTHIPRGGTLDRIQANLSQGRSEKRPLARQLSFLGAGELRGAGPGEPVDSERIVNEYGPAIMTAMHSTVDRHLEYGEDPPEFLRPIWKDYLEFHMSRPAAERQKMMHESHNAYVAPDERRFVTPKSSSASASWASRPKCWSRCASWRRKGVRQLMCNFPLERGYQMVRNYAKNIIQKL
jgi:hypothetical protein